MDHDPGSQRSTSKTTRALTISLKTMIKMTCHRAQSFHRGTTLPQKNGLLLLQQEIPKMTERTQKRITRRTLPRRHLRVITTNARQALGSQHRTKIRQIGTHELVTNLNRLVISLSMMKNLARTMILALTMIHTTLQAPTPISHTLKITILQLQPEAPHTTEIILRTQLETQRLSLSRY